jgi:cellulose biosynthesis protein BcsQ
VLGLVVTKYRENKYTIDSDQIEKYLEMPILSKIPHDENFDRAIHRKIPFIEAYPYRKAAKEYLDLARRIINSDVIDEHLLR